MDSANVASEPVILSPSHPLFAIFGRASGQIFGKNMVLASYIGLVTLVQKGRGSSRLISELDSIKVR